MLAALRTLNRPPPPLPAYPPLPEPNGYDEISRVLHAFRCDSADGLLRSLEGMTPDEIEGEIHGLIDVPGLRRALRVTAWTPEEEVDDTNRMLAGTPITELPETKRRKAVLLLNLLAQVKREMGCPHEGLWLSLDAAEMSIGSSRGSGFGVNICSTSGCLGALDVATSCLQGIDASQARSARKRIQRIVNIAPTMADALQVERRIARIEIIGHPTKDSVLSRFQQRELDDWYVELIAEAAKAPLERRWPKPHKLNILAGITFPVIASTEEMFHRRNRGLAEFATRLAIREFEAYTGRPPQSLQELVPGTLDAIPLDPVSGAPVQYRLDDNGGYTLKVGD